MAVLAGHQSIVGIKKGSTWGTGVQCDKRLRLSQLTNTLSFAEQVSGNHDMSYLPKSVKRGANTTGGTIQVEAGFGGEWLILAALFGGNANASPAEVNGGQGDYLHTMDFAGYTSANQYFFSLAHLIESDVVGEFTSAMAENFNFAGTINAGLQVSTGFVAERYKNATTATSAANLAALSFTQDPEEKVVFNGANMYARIAPYSSSTALDSDDNVNFTQFSINFSRTLTRVYGASGADTQFSKLPFIASIINAQFSMTLANIDDSVTDLFAKYEAGTPLMAEIFVDGGVIGAGANTSLKFAIPYIVPLTVGGYGIGGQAPLANPVITGRLSTVGTAASAMTGSANSLMRLSSVDKRTTSYTA